MSTQSVTAAIKHNPRAQGLAIIVTNDYCATVFGQSVLKPLSGTFHDGKNMNEAFLALGFAVHWVCNIESQQFTELIYETSNLEYHIIRKYRCIVFVFSGHGDQGDIVYLQDGSEVSIGEGIIKPFLPKSSPQIGKLQKLFFFDACRGKQESKPVAVPKGCQPRSKTEANPLKFDSRGGSLFDRIRVPEEGGFLVAYSTMSNCLAWEEQKGGAWLQRLAKEITINTSSIEDVLTKVNSDMVRDQTDKIQQPEKLSRLNDLVYLNPKPEEKAPSKVKIAAVFPSQPTSLLDRTEHAFSQAVLSPASPGASDSLAMQKLVSLYPSAKIKDIKYHHHYQPEYQATYYRCQVVISLPGQQDIVGDSCKYFMSEQDSRENAIKNVLSQIHPQQAVVSGYLTTPGVQPEPLSHQCQIPTPHQYQSSAASDLIPQSITHNQEHVGYSTATPTQVAATGATPSQSGSISNWSQQPVEGASVNFKQQVNTFFQENGVIDPDYEYVPDGSKRFRCIVRYQLNGVSKTVDSKDYYLSKSEAKEQVAKLVVSKEKVSQVISRGIKGSTPPSKIWKSKLKEYCDKRKVGSDAMPSYHTVRCCNGFKSTVTFIGRSVEGGVCKSKQEAEQNAAQCALQTL